MTKENIQEFAVALNSSPSEGEGSEAKRNKKTQLLSALLSASALGVFLEGCGSTFTSSSSSSRDDPNRAGNDSNPFVATAGADDFSGSGNDGWVSYAGSNAGVTIDLDDSPTTVSGGWAARDNLKYIYNLIGSIHADTLTGGEFSFNSFEGGPGDDVLAGASTYVFNAGDGTDTISDNNGNIIFKQGTNDDYAGATYAFAYIDNSSSKVMLTVTKSGRTLNTIEFSTYPVEYKFYTRSSGRDIEVPESSINLPAGRGGENNPLAASASANIFTGAGIYDWVSYAGSNEGVTINLNGRYSATTSGGWAAGDTLTYIDNLIGSDHADTLTGDNGRNTFEGGRGDDVLAGGSGTDTYVFNAVDGTDTITDSGINKIVFEQGTNNDYAGATYALAYVEDSSDTVRLTVTKGGNTLNIIDFSEHPYAYTFATRSGSSDTAIPASSLTLPARRGSEENPFVATSAADRFTGSEDADWVNYEDSNEGVTISLYSSTASGGWAAEDTLTDINNLIGSIHADTLTGDSSANTLHGGIGNDIIRGGGRDDIISGGAGNDELYGGTGLDYLYGGSGDDLLVDRGDGSEFFDETDYMYGQAGADTYRFDAGSNTGPFLTLDIDVIYAAGDETGNKVIFRAPSGSTYDSDDFAFSRGRLGSGGSDPFVNSRTGDDLEIVVKTGYSINTNNYRNVVVIKDYFDQQDNAYTIYHTDYGSTLDGTAVGGQPAETS